MTRLFRSTATRVWLMLITATLLSWALAENAAAARLATTSVMLIAAFKVRLVFNYFMELTWKAGAWRIAYELWTGMVTLLILGGYWYAELCY